MGIQSMSERKPAILPPSRYPSGGKRMPKTTQEALNEIAERERLEVVATVIRQPHRVGSPDPQSPLLGCAIGRFVVKHKMAVEIVAASDVYAQTKRKWLSVKGVPLETRLGGSGADVDPETVAKWRDVWRGIESSVAGVAGMNALSLIEGAAIHDVEIPASHHVPQVKLGLIELAYSAGKLARPRTP